MRSILLLLLLLLLLLCRVAPGAARWAVLKSRLERHDVRTRNYLSATSGPRPLFQHGLRERPNDGVGDDTPGEYSTDIRAVDKKVEAIEEEIQTVGREIGSVATKIEAVEAALFGGPTYPGITDHDLLLKKEEHWLREERSSSGGENSCC